MKDHLPEAGAIAQPPPERWAFMDDLKSPLHRPLPRLRQRPDKHEVDLSAGVRWQNDFGDDTKTLQTAYSDFENYLESAGIQKKGTYPIRIRKHQTPCFEAYRLEVGVEGCILGADDPEGIRRGLVFLEDEIRRTGGPFLATGLRERRPLIRTRISRCFFGPIKRPPMNRDELADDVNYYPDEYLNRLAHEGVNGLWLTVAFRELCPSPFFKEFGVGRGPKLAKLRATVKQCARYGIKIYPFCIEPQGFGHLPEYMLPTDFLEGNGVLAGNRGWATNFCTSTPEGLSFVEECTAHLFDSVPDLGGLIAINMGERPTHCYSETTHFFDNNCPRCSQRKPWQVMADTTAAFSRGMRRVNPKAEMISWLYVPTLDEMEKKKPVLEEIAAHVPCDVTLQYNFESGGEVSQLGKTRIALDYWLAWPGPSQIFRDLSARAIQAGARMSAKIQVGCSHEVATIPFIPVPGNLYQKYRAMHELGVSTVMQCWYFGNYPGLMNKAAGELSFSPVEDSEENFLKRLASLDWPGREDTVVAAWQAFQEAYRAFPVNLPFTWYGPLHHAVVWPLHLIPVDRPMAPSWKFTFPENSGDRIGECMGYGHSLPEVLTLLDTMNRHWQRGLAQMKGLRSFYSGNSERLLDIGLVEAIGLQIMSAHRVFMFYDLREKLPFAAPGAQREMVSQMKKWVASEIEVSTRLIDLCRADSRLGFHSEAEGYKYFPEKIVWRTQQLAKMCEDEFPLVETKIEKGHALFPEYTGKDPKGRTYRCQAGGPPGPWEVFHGGSGRWRAAFDGMNLIVGVEMPLNAASDRVFLEVEPRRLWPLMKFEAGRDGSFKHHNKLPTPDGRWRVETRVGESGWSAEFHIPMAVIREEEGGHPLRLNVQCGGMGWLPKHPWPDRLFFGNDNPADLGWMIFT